MSVFFILKCNLLLFVKFDFFRMIYYLISDQIKNFGLKRSFILKVMNFLIFSDFLEFF